MILYFSGTGNSKYVAERISGKLGESAPVSLNELVKTGKPETFEANEPYVFCYPTYAWRMPRFLETYLKKCSFSGDRRAYFIATCGDSVGASADYAKRLCEEIGLEYMGLKAIKMPENYIAVFNCPTEEKCRDIVEKAKSEIDDAVAMIEDRTVIKEKSGPKILSNLVNSLFYRFIVKAKPFHLEKECISCGLCAKSCVLNNIELVRKSSEGTESAEENIPVYEPPADNKKILKPGAYDNTGEKKETGTLRENGNRGTECAGGKPVWGDNCTHCMACITVCPVSAIEYGNKTRKKRRYRFE